MKLAIILALLASTACAGHNDCDAASLENLTDGTCAEPWSDENVPEFSAQGNNAMFYLCRETAQQTRVNEPAEGGPQDIVYCVLNDTPDSYPLAWGTGFRAGVLLANSADSMSDLIYSYWESL